MVKINKTEVVKAVWPLQGKSFKDREALEDSVFPFFASLQIYFEGKGHRDLVDWLLANGCVVLENHELVVKLPTPPTTQISDDTGKAFEISDPSIFPEVSFSELQMLHSIGTAPTIETRHLLSLEILSLIGKKLVQYGADGEAAVLESSHRLSVRRAKEEIDREDYPAACDALEDALRAKERLSEVKNVVSITDLGKKLLKKLSDTKIKI